VTTAAVGAIGLVHDEHELWFLRLLLSGILATPLAFAAHRLERFGRHIALLMGGLAAACVLAAVWAGSSTRHALESEAFVWPYLLSLIAAILVPFVLPGPRFSRFVRRFFEQTTTWGVLCGCAVAAVQVIALALHELFDLRTRELGVDASIAVACGLILIYLHRLRADGAPGGGRIPELWRRFATMIGAPFVSAMLAILVVYEIWARVRGELPRNILSPLIIAAGVVGFLSTLIIAAVLDEAPATGALAPADPQRWTRTWSVRLTRAFPVVLLALLPMAWWALGIRIEEHGITPFRAVRAMGLLCLSCLSLLGASRWLRGRAALSWEVPAAIAGFALITAFGPVSAIELTVRSQSARLDRMLAELEASWPAGRTPDRHEIELTAQRYDALHGALYEVRRLGGQPALQRALGGSRVRCSWTGEDCPERLAMYRSGARHIDDDDGGDWWAMEIPAGARLVTRGGEIEIVELYRPLGSALGAASHGTSSVWLDADRVVIHDGDQIRAEVSIAQLIAQSPRDRTLATDPLPLRRPDGVVIADLAIRRLDVWVPHRGPPQAHQLVGLVTWRP
jgi:hypothetical protein